MNTDTSDPENAHRGGMTRRQALWTGAAAIAAPLVLPSSLFGQGAPSKRINVAMIGVGRQAMYANLKPFLFSDHARVVAVCDVDRWRLDKAKAEVDAHYKDSACFATTDWREALARDDVDAVMNSTPDHWHIPISLAAVRRKLHVSCEKPLTRWIAEGRRLADEVAGKGVVFRTDSECRSHAYMHKSAGLVRNGYIGNLKRMVVIVPRGDEPGGDPTPADPPADLDYEMWTGPAPMKPYCVDRVHAPETLGRPGWMRCLDTCEGMITNWGTHLLDVAQLGHDSERTGPVSVEAVGKYPEPGSGLWNVLVDFTAQFRYADGVVLDYRIAPEDDKSEASILFEGDEGWIKATWFGGSQGLTASSDALLKTKLKEGDVQLPQRADKEDFIHGIRTGEPTMADAEIGHRTCSIGQLAHIAIQRGKPLRWDPAKEVFDDMTATGMLRGSYREPWML